MTAMMEAHETSVIPIMEKVDFENPSSLVDNKTITIMDVIPESPNPSNAESDESTIAAEEEKEKEDIESGRLSREDDKDGRDHIIPPSVSLSTLQRTNDRLEKTLRDAKVREDRLREHLNRLNMSTSRTERQLKEATDGKENLENEVKALSTLNGRLAEELHRNHAMMATLESEKKELEAKIEGIQFERFKLNNRNTLEKVPGVIEQLSNVEHESTATEAHEQDETEQKDEVEIVERNLKTALSKADAVNTACVQQSGAIDIIRQAYTHARKQLEFAQFKLTLAKSVEEEQRAQVQVLKNREALLLKEMRELHYANETLEIELRHSEEDLERTKSTLDLFKIELELSRAQSSMLKQQQDDAEKLNEDATIKLKQLRTKLLIAADENSKLHEKLAQSETALKETYAVLEMAEESIFDLKAQVQMLQSETDENMLADEPISEPQFSTTEPMFGSKHIKQDSGISMAESFESTASAISIYEVSKAEKIEFRKSKIELLDSVSAGNNTKESEEPLPTEAMTEENQEAPNTAAKDNFNTIAILPSPTGAQVDNATPALFVPLENHLPKSVVALKEVRPVSDIPSEPDKPAPSASLEYDKPAPDVPFEPDRPASAIPLENDRSASAQASTHSDAEPNPRPKSQMSGSTSPPKVINFSRRRSLGHTSQPVDRKDKPATSLLPFEGPQPSPIPIPFRARSVNVHDIPLPIARPIALSRSNSENSESQKNELPTISKLPRRRWSLRNFDRQRSGSVSSAPSVGSVNSLRLSAAPSFRDMQQLGERPRGLESIVEVSSPISPAPPHPPEEKPKSPMKTSNLERSASTKEVVTRRRNSYVMTSSPRPVSTIHAFADGIGKSRVRKVIPSLDLGNPTLRSSTSLNDMSNNSAVVRKSYVYNPGQHLGGVKSEFDRLSGSFDDGELPQKSPEKLSIMEFMTRETINFDKPLNAGVPDKLVGRKSESSRDSDSMRRKDSDSSSSKKSVQTEKANLERRVQMQQPNPKKEISNQDKAKKGGGWMSSIISRVRWTKA